MNEQPSVRLQLTADSYQRIISGHATEDDNRLLRSGIISAGNPGPYEVPNCVVTVAGAPRDIVIGTKIVHGVEESALLEAVQRAIAEVRTDEVEHSLEEYVRVLRQFNSSAYRTLPLPDDLTLDDVFVPIRAKVIQSDEMTGSFSIAEIFKNATRLARGPNLLIQGQPGAGKSTLLRKIAKSAWMEPSAIGLDRPHLPMLIRLQALANCSGVTLEERLLAAIADARDYALTQRPAEGFFVSWPKRLTTSWILLLDGFDEVPRDRQAEIKAWIRERKQAGIWVVVTSRPTTGLDTLFVKNFSVFEIEPFNLEQQRQLAQVFLPDRGEVFLQSLSETNVDFIFTTPLLVSIAAIVYRRDGSLPTRRVDLYKRLIDQWIDEMRATATGPDISAEMSDYVLPALEHLGLYMTEQPHSAAFDSALISLTEFLAAGTGRPRALLIESARRLLDFITRRSGILLAFGGSCDWLHRTFREYMAARALAGTFAANSARAAGLVKLWDQDLWKQVLLFSLSIWSETQPVSELLAGISSEKVPYGLVFCGTAIAEGTSITEEFEGSIVQELCDIARKNSEGSICPRLMAGVSDDSIERAQKVLQVIRQVSNRPLSHKPFFKLIESMDYSARTWRAEQGNAAINDLATLGRRSELRSLANDRSLHHWVRHQAARELAEMGETAAPIKVAVELLQDPAALNIAGHLIDTLGKCTATPELRQFISASASQPSLQLRATDVLASTSDAMTLQEVANDPSLPAAVRDRALLALLASSNTEDSNAMLRQMFGAGKRDTVDLENLLGTMRQARNWAAITAIILFDDAPEYIRRECIEFLKVENNWDELVALLQIPVLEPIVGMHVARTIAGKGDVQEVAPIIIAFCSHLIDNAEYPLLLDAIKLRAEIYLHNSDYGLAIQDLDRIIIMEGRDDRILSLRGNAHRMLGNYESSADDFNLALEINPSDRCNLIGRGLSNYHLEKWTEANQDFAKASKLGTEETNFYKYYARSLLKAGDLVAALKVANQAAYIDFLAPEPYAFRAEIHGARGEWDAAMDDIDQALMLDGKYIWARRNRGFLQRLQGNLEAARCDLMEALALEPHCQEVRLELAATLIMTNDWEGAIEVLGEVGDGSDGSEYYLHKAFLQWLATQLATQVGAELPLVTLPRSVFSDSLSDGNVNCSPVLIFRVALCRFVERYSEQKCVQRIIQEAGEAQLRQNIVPDLEMVSRILVGRDEVYALKRLAIDRLTKISVARRRKEGHMQKKDQKRHTDSGHERDRAARRNPVYCTLHSIIGFDNFKERALGVLKAEAGSERTVVFLSLDDGWVYGQCNFKMSPGDSYDLKFVDLFETIIQRNLEIFSRGGIGNFLFVERELRDKFEDAASEALDRDTYRFFNFRLVKRRD